MIIADITVLASSVRVSLHDKLPLGAAGLTVRFHFTDPVWEHLSKTVVFRNRSSTLDVTMTQNCAVIPHELLTKVMDVIDVGVYGTDSDQLLAIPTVWGQLGTVEGAAQPSGDPATDPTLPYWAQLKEQVDAVQDNMMNRENLEEALLRAKESGDFDGPQGPKGDPGQPGAPGANGADGADGKDGYTPVKGLDYWTAEEQNQIVAAASAKATNAVAHSSDIVCEAQGNALTLTDSASRSLRGLTLYGKTSQNGTPTPEAPVALDSAGSNGSIQATFFNGNLCDPHGFSYSDHYTVDNEGFIHFTNSYTGTGDTYRMYPDYYLPVPKGTYTVTVEMDANIEHYVGNDTIDFSKPQQNPASYVLTDAVEICVMFVVPTVTSFKFRVTINFGSTALPYQPYSPPKALTVPTPSGLPGIPVSSGGNYTDDNGQQWICDELDIDRGVYIQRVEKITANVLAERGAFSINSLGLPCINLTLASQQAENHPVRSNCYQQISTGVSIRHGTMKNWGNQITLCDNRFASMEQGVSLLAEEDFLLLVKLGTPVETVIPADQLPSLEDVYTHYPDTVIYNDAGTGMTVGYVADSKLYIDNKFAELAAAIASNA